MNGPEHPTVDAIPGNVAQWHVNTRSLAGDHAAMIGMSTVTDTGTDQEPAARHPPSPERQRRHRTRHHSSVLTPRRPQCNNHHS